MKRHRNWIVCIALGSLWVSGARARGDATTRPDGPPSATIAIDNFRFQPNELTVNVGTTVIWTNHDDVPHTATAQGNSPLFDSGALDTDDHFSFTFRSRGTYRYYCKVHPHMTGVVIVK